MSIKEIVVVGSGMVGSVICADLVASGFDVTVADVSEESLAVAKKRCGGKVKTIQADLSIADELVKIVKPFELMVNCLPGFMGLQAIKTVLEKDCVTKVCDISFMPEDAMDEANGLVQLAKEKKATVLVDCGVAPGISHMLLGNGQSLMSHVKTAKIFVGGLPHTRVWPFQYKAPFSPIDVFEEYTRPVYIIENGEKVVKEPMSGIELVDFPGVGTVEAFFTDGLRSLLRNIKADNMYEKTCRYLGIPEQIKQFRAAGFFDEEPVEVHDAETGKLVKVMPREVTAKLLFPKWKYEEGEVDLTIMRSEVTGISKKTGKEITEIWSLTDMLDPATNFPSMSRTTGFPCCIGTRMIADGTLKDIGVIFPEEIGGNQPLWERVVAELKERGVNVVYEQGELKK